MCVFMRWWLLICIMVAFSYIASLYGIFDKIIEIDFTYICFTIIIVTLYATAKCGYFTFKASLTNKRKELERLKSKQELGWMLANVVSLGGLIGTVIGFIFVLSSFKGIDFTNVTATQQLVKSIGSNIGLALWTTLTGQLCAVILILQYFNLSNYIDNKLLKWSKKNVKK